MIIILNCGPLPIGAAKCNRIVAALLEHADKRYLCQPSAVRMIDVEMLGTPEETVAGIPLTPEQWAHWAVVPYLPIQQPGSRALLDAVNARRGGVRTFVAEMSSGEWRAVWEVSGLPPYGPAHSDK